MSKSTVFSATSQSQLSGQALTVFYKESYDGDGDDDDDDDDGDVGDDDDDGKTDCTWVNFKKEYKVAGDGDGDTELSI